MSSTTGSTVTASPSATTTYTVTVTDSTAATASSSQVVTVNPQLSVSLTGSPASPIVLGTAVNLTATASGGTPPYSFSWSRGAVGSPNNTMSTDTDTPPVGDTTYSVTVTDSRGCTAGASTTVHVFDYTISLSPSSQTVLAGTPATYTVSAGVAAGSTGTPASVSLSITGAPAGATVSAPGSISLPGSTTVTVTPTTATLGDFTLFASGSVGGTSRMSSGAGLHVYDFTLSVAPTTQTVTVGGGPATYTVSVSLLPGSTATGVPIGANLAVIGLPGTVTPAVSPSVAFGASVPLTLAIGSTSPADYPFAVVGAVPGGGRTSNTAHLIIAFNICFLYDQAQVKQLGSTVPIKVQICDANGVNLSSPSIALHAVFEQLVSGVVTSVPVLDSGNANPDNDFRFDSTLGTTGGYIFNLKTTNLLSSGVWAMVFQVGTLGPSGFTATDPTFHQAQFGVK